MVAEILELKKHQVELIRGHKSHSKVIALTDTGMTVDDVIQKIKEQL